MRRAIPYRALSLALLCTGLVAAGCAQTPTAAPSGPVAVGSTPAAPSSGATPSGPSTGSGPSSPSVPSGCQPRTDDPVVLSEQDNGHTVCLKAGTHLEVYLHGTADDRWSTPTSATDVLKPAPNGKGALMLGVSAGFFVSDHAGRTTVSATRDATRFEVVVSVS